MKTQELRFKNALILIIALFSLSLLFAQTPFTTWDFENQDLVPVLGTGTLTTTNASVTTSFITGWIGTGTGGFALQTTGYPEQGAGSETSGIQAVVPTTGKTNIVVAWDQRNSNTGANRMRLQYTLNGTTWVNFEASAANATNINSTSQEDGGYDNGLYIVNAGATWFSRTANFTAIAGANNNPNFGIRILTAFESGTSAYGAAGGGTYGTGGTYRFDNLSFGFTDSNTVLPPVIAPNGGICSAPIQVSITCPTADAQIRYTLDGNDPTEASTLYANPFEVSTTTTVKAIAYKTGMDASSIVSATYSFPVNIANLSLLRQQNPDGTTIYRVQNEVLLSYFQSFRYNKFVQDANAGILIDDYNHVITTNYNINDGITGITGKISEYNGMLQFVPVADPGQPSSTNNTINPIYVTISQLTSNFNEYESRLCVIRNAQFVNAPADTFGVGAVYPISDATGDFNFRTTFYDTDYISGNVPTTPIHIVGLPHERLNGQDVAKYFCSRSLADFVSTPISDQTTTKVTKLNGNYPNPFNPTTTISYQLGKEQPVDITIYNVKGQKVRNLVNSTQTAGQHTITWNGTNDNNKSVASGIYYYKLSTTDKTEVRKAILMK